MANNAVSHKKTSHIEKFNGLDFTFWKKQVLIVLKVHKLDEITLGTITCPVQKLNNDGSVLLENGIPTEKVAIEDWTNEDLQVQNILFSTINQGNVSKRYYTYLVHRSRERTFSHSKNLTEINSNYLHTQVFAESFWNARPHTKCGVD